MATKKEEELTMDDEIVIQEELSTATDPQEKASDFLGIEPMPGPQKLSVQSIATITLIFIVVSLLTQVLAHQFLRGPTTNSPNLSATPRTPTPPAPKTSYHQEIWPSATDVYKATEVIAKPIPGANDGAVILHVYCEHPEKNLLDLFVFEASKKDSERFTKPDFIGKDFIYKEPRDLSYEGLIIHGTYKYRRFRIGGPGSFRPIWAFSF